MKICHICGANVIDSASFCTECGAPFAPAAPAVPENTPVVPAIPENTPMFPAVPEPSVPENPIVVPAVDSRVQENSPVDPAAYFSQNTSENAAAYFSGETGGNKTPTFSRGGTAEAGSSSVYEQYKGLIITIRIFMIIGCVMSITYLFIPLIWRIPMTIILFRKFRQGEPISTVYKVAVLCLVDMVAGVLLLMVKPNDISQRYRR